MLFYFACYLFLNLNTLFFVPFTLAANEQNGDHKVNEELQTAKIDLQECIAHPSLSPTPIDNTEEGCKSSADDLVLHPESEDNNKQIIAYFEQLSPFFLQFKDNFKDFEILLLFAGLEEIELYLNKSIDNSNETSSISNVDMVESREKNRKLAEEIIEYRNINLRKFFKACDITTLNNQIKSKYADFVRVFNDLVQQKDELEPSRVTDASHTEVLDGLKVVESELKSTDSDLNREKNSDKVTEDTKIKVLGFSEQVDDSDFDKKEENVNVVIGAAPSTIKIVDNQQVNGEIIDSAVVNEEKDIYKIPVGSENIELNPNGIFVSSESTIQEVISCDESTIKAEPTKHVLESMLKSHDCLTEEFKDLRNKTTPIEDNLDEGKNRGLTQISSEEQNIHCDYTLGDLESYKDVKSVSTGMPKEVQKIHYDLVHVGLDSSSVITHDYNNNLELKNITDNKPVFKMVNEPVYQYYSQVMHGFHPTLKCNSGATKKDFETCFSVKDAASLSKSIKTDKCYETNTEKIDTNEGEIHVNKVSEPIIDKNTFAVIFEGETVKMGRDDFVLYMFEPLKSLAKNNPSFEKQFGKENTAPVLLAQEFTISDKINSDSEATDDKEENIESESLTPEFNYMGEQKNENDVEKVSPSKSSENSSNEKDHTVENVSHIHVLKHNMKGSKSKLHHFTCHKYPCVVPRFQNDSIANFPDDSATKVDQNELIPFVEEIISRITTNIKSSELNQFFIEEINTDLELLREKIDDFIILHKNNNKTNDFKEDSNSEHKNLEQTESNTALKYKSNENVASSSEDTSMEDEQLLYVQLINNANSIKEQADSKQSISENPQDLNALENENDDTVLIQNASENNELECKNNHPFVCLHWIKFLEEIEDHYITSSIKFIFGDYFNTKTARTDLIKIFKHLLQKESLNESRGEICLMSEEWKLLLETPITSCIPGVSTHDGTTTFEPSHIDSFLQLNLQRVKHLLVHLNSNVLATKNEFRVGIEKLIETIKKATEPNSADETYKNNSEKKYKEIFIVPEKIPNSIQTQPTILQPDQSNEGNQKLENGIIEETKGEKKPEESSITETEVKNDKQAESKINSTMPFTKDESKTAENTTTLDADESTKSKNGSDDAGKLEANNSTENESESVDNTATAGADESSKLNLKNQENAHESNTTTQTSEENEKIFTDGEFLILGIVVLIFTGGTIAGFVVWRKKYYKQE